MSEHRPIRTNALLLGSGFIFAAGALLGLSLPMRAELEGFPTYLVGFIGSAFAAGFVAGCLLVPRLVAKVGHVRVFGVMAALVAVTGLVNLLFIDPIAWVLVRAMTGFAFAGATMIIESRISESATSETRGSIFARYMIVTLASSVLGRLSDRMDRRRLLIIIALAGTVLSLALSLLDLREPAAVILLVTVLGGAMHTLYPVAVAHANRCSPPRRRPCTSTRALKNRMPGTDLLR